MVMTETTPSSEASGSKARGGRKTSFKVAIQPLLDCMDGSNVAKARRLGVDPTVIYRYTRGGCPLYSADILAARIGVHPTEIWDDWDTYPDLEDGTVRGG